MKKRCSICRKIKPLSEFYIRSDRNKPIARCKKCQSLLAKKRYAKLTLTQRQKLNKDRANWLKEQAKKGNLKPILQHKFNSYKTNAKRKNVAFAISVKYLIDLFNKQKGLCYYSGRKLTVATGHWTRLCPLVDTPNQFSLDRIIPKKGYTEGNLVWCCWLINTMKNHLTENQFYDLCQEVLDHKKGR